MLTDKQLESAARKLCGIRGIDPDSSIVRENKCGSDGVILDVLTMSKAWSILKDEILAIDQINDAISFGVENEE